jgi:hypothetical protein
MFFITCIDNLSTFDYQRTFGYTQTFEEAEKKLNENYLDLHEYLYQYAVVEKIPAGIHQTAEKEVWFKWNEEKGGFFQIDKPSEVLSFCNFALG